MTARAGDRAVHRNRHEQVRGEIVSALVDLLASTPFADITIDELARRAGLSRSAFYFYFRDKIEVLGAAATEAGEILYAQADRWWSGAGTPEALARDALGGVAHAYAEHAAVLRATTEVSTYVARVAALWRALIDRFIDATAAHLRAEQARGVASPALDPEATAAALVWMVERCCYVYIAGGEREVDELIDGIIAIWLAVIYPASGRS